MRKKTFPHSFLILIAAMSQNSLLTTMISGFTIVKDVLRQGYPFVEAIASALPICDEFLISEGYSTDGTYEVIQRIVSLNKKVKVFRQHWPAANNRKRGAWHALLLGILRMRSVGNVNMIISSMSNPEK